MGERNCKVMVPPRKTFLEFGRQLLQRYPVKIVGFVIIPACNLFVKRNHPDLVVGVFDDIMNPTVDDTFRVIRLILVNPHLITIVFAEARPGAEPHKAILVFSDTMYGVLWQSVLGGNVVKSKIKGLPVAPVRQ